MLRLFVTVSHSCLLLPDLGRHRVGAELPDRRRQRADPDGDRLRRGVQAGAAAVPPGGEGADGGAEGRGQHRDRHGRADADGAQQRGPLALPGPPQPPQGEDQQGEKKFFSFVSSSSKGNRERGALGKKSLQIR